MEARELRMFNAIKRFGEIVYVNEYTFEDIKNNNGSYSPIELTEEWLVKFGFEKSGGVWENSDCPFAIDFEGKYPSLCFEYYGGDTYSHQIPYVHQLQNAHFALTGEELTPKTNTN